jgi:hypothetical protein
MVVGQQWIRSFEEVRPGDTAYLMFPQRCDPETTKGCANLEGGLVYRLNDQGEARNITSQVAPPKPRLMPAERSLYLAHGGLAISLDASKLRNVPTLRWYMEFDPDTPISDSDPRRFGNFAHFGFLVWNGRRFEAKQRVPRSIWPCRPVSAGAKTCSREIGPDPFVKE